MTAGAKIERKRDEAIAALLTQPTIEAAARAARIGEKTLRRWLQQADFAQAYAVARRQVLDLAIGSVAGLAAEGVAAVRRNLQHDVPLPLQLRAGLGVLALGLKASELLDVLARLDAFEARVTALDSSADTAADPAEAWRPLADRTGVRDDE